MSETLSRAADVADYTWFWWKLRPHPRLGTVEIRSLDAQTRLADTAGLVALVHCLARHAAQADAEPDPAPELVEEGLFRAARFGVQADLPNAQGMRIPVPDLLEQALGRARPFAQELGCTAQLAVLPELVRRGGGAGAQRAVYELAGIEAVTRELTGLTTEHEAE
jgi:glutamate---cysteine ligase / carboxylate-amine ligase